MYRKLAPKLFGNLDVQSNCAGSLRAASFVQIRVNSPLLRSHAHDPPLQVGRRARNPPSDFGPYYFNPRFFSVISAPAVGSGETAIAALSCGNRIYASCASLTSGQHDS